MLTPNVRRLNETEENVVGVARYTRKHRKTRFKVENSIGIMKEQFPVLNYMRVKNQSRVSAIVMCCITLHNMQNKYCNGIYDGVLGDIANREPNNENNQDEMENDFHQVQGYQRQREFIEYFNGL